MLPELSSSRTRVLKRLLARPRAKAFRTGKFPNENGETLSRGRMIVKQKNSLLKESTSKLLLRSPWFRRSFALHVQLRAFAWSHCVCLRDLLRKLILIALPAVNPLNLSLYCYFVAANVPGVLLEGCSRKTGGKSG